MNISLRKSVRRNIMLLALLLGSVLSLSAQQVTQEAALKKAEQFLGKTNISRRAPRKAPQLTLANNRDEFYVFNDKANGGYVIVSGEERMPDVLAYSYDSRFDADNIPCNMKAWLEGCAEQVKYLRAHPEASARRTTTERENIDPLLPCSYDQATPYNDKCPEVDGEHCLTGCVATAMAQIMYYWQWPKQTTDVIPGYTTNTHKIEMPAIPVTTIDWDNMLGAYYYNDYTEKQADAISTLMLLCGTSVKMNYTPSESGALSSVAAQAFRNYFDFNNILEYLSSDAYKTEYWRQLIYDELKNKRPVYASGIGHAFVLDGYQDGYFHANWGPGDVYIYEYSQGYDAIINVQPALADNPSQYAVFDNGTMTLYYDNKKSGRSGTILPRQEDWKDYVEEITECIIDKSFANLKLRNLRNFFYGWRNLKSIKGLENLNTSEVYDMYGMFRSCSSLTNLDVSGFKTDNVTDMMGVFYGCSSLTSLDVSGFKTDNVTKMSRMFGGCYNLTSLDVSGFKTDNVKDMGNMFANCYELSTIYASERWNMDNVEYTESMFSDCSKIVGGEGTTYDPDHTNNDYARIDEGPSKPGYFTKKAPQYYTITYMVDGEEFKSLYLEVGTAITAEDEPTKKGYTFSGWSEIPETMPAHDVTVTGTFTVNKYKLTYMVDGEEYKTFEVEYGTAITAEDEPTKEGYTFSGWSEIPETMPAHDVTVTGTFTVNKYKLTYMVDGEEYKTSEVEYGTAITAEDEPTKEGYTFSGWSEIPETMPAHDVTVNGTFTVNKYKLTYMVDGEEYKTFEVEYGTAITAEAEPTKEGYTFSGWSEIPEMMPAHDVTVTGTFEKNTIPGDVNGDGVVNVTDIVATVNYIMEKPSDGFNKEAADLNGDGEINVTDIVKMVTIIMSGDGGSSRRAAATSGNCFER